MLLELGSTMLIEILTKPYIEFEKKTCLFSRLSLKLKCDFCYETIVWSEAVIKRGQTLFYVMHVLYHYHQCHQFLQYFIFYLGHFETYKERK